MVGAGMYPVEGRNVQATVSVDFYHAFVSITNPVFAYAGHFMFFILISEMRQPQDAMKAAYTLQIFATTFYVVFAVVVYCYIGETVASPAFSSLPPKWAKAAYGVAIPNFLIAGSLYSHTAAKLFFIRIFRKSVHLHEHTVMGWGVWTLLIILCNGAAFILAVGVPVSFVINLLLDDHSANISGRSSHISWGLLHLCSLHGILMGLPASSGSMTPISTKEASELGCGSHL